MKFSQAWLLGEWTAPSISTKELSQQLTALGLEVDSIDPVAGEFSHVVVGQVVEVNAHPDAKKLQCCRVSVGGDELVGIVCGAKNVRAGLKVAVAMVGAKLPGDLIIKEAKLRGAPSFGMLCSEQELGLADDSEGIMELPDDAPVGDKVRDYLLLDDVIFDIDLTPNRGDCLSIAGVAREVAAKNQSALTPVDCSAVIGDASLSFAISHEAKQDCPRYITRVIEGIDNTKSSPLWLKERLRRSGLRSINAVVDVMNYVMIELGQPLHAFDLKTLSGKLVVRRAEKGEKLQLLDEREVKLNEDDLVIADEKEAHALAGVMGGFDSGVVKSSTSIIVESAFFDPILIAKTARLYGISSDAAYRFERGVDWQLQSQAIERATQLLLTIVGGKAGVVNEAVAEEHLPSMKTVQLRSHRLTQILGIEIAKDDVTKILERLGMTDLSVTKEGWSVVAPSYRFDIVREEDLIEEVARLYGYDNIPCATASMPAAVVEKEGARHRKSRLCRLLSDLGYFETINYSFVSERLQALLDPEHEPRALENPLTPEMALMRTSLLPGLISTLQHNVNRQQANLKLFEWGNCFVRHTNQQGWQQVSRLGGVISGVMFPEGWAIKSRSVDFFDVKAHVTALFAEAGLKDIHWHRESGHLALHPGQSAAVYTGEQRIGVIGSLHPKTEIELGLDSQVIVFELETKFLIAKKQPQFSCFSKYPSVRRDIAIVVDEAVSVGDIMAEAKRSAGKYLEAIGLFDVYQGEGVKKGQKSVALALTFCAVSFTLRDEEINKHIQDVVASLEGCFQAKLRM